MADEEPSLHTPVVGTQEDIRAILGWQHDRYHHLQVLSQGLFSSLVAIVALFVTVYVVFVRELPSLPTEFETYESVAQTVPVGPLAVGFTFVLNYLLVGALLFLALSSLLVAATRLYGLVTDDRLETGLSPQTGGIHETETLPSELCEALDVDSASARFATAVRHNHSQLDAVHREFKRGAIRVLTFTLLVLSAVTVYYYISDHAVDMLVATDVLFMLPAPAMNYFWQRVMAANRDHAVTERPNSQSLAQEIFTEDEGRWGLLRMGKAEQLVSLVMTLLAVLVPLSWLLSLGVQQVL